jgi:hypothetical protein
VPTLLAKTPLKDAIHSTGFASQSMQSSRALPSLTNQTIFLMPSLKKSGPAFERTTLIIHFVSSSHSTLQALHSTFLQAFSVTPGRHLPKLAETILVLPAKSNQVHPAGSIFVDLLFMKARILTLSANFWIRLAA